MKPLIILFSLLLSTTAFCQSAVDSFFNIKTQKPPENWVELIQGQWRPYKQVGLIDDTVFRSDYSVWDDFGNIKFDSLRIVFGIYDSLSHLSSPNLIDRMFGRRHDTIGYRVIYFPRKNTFCCTHDVKSGYASHRIYKVINVTDQFFSFEMPNIFYYIDTKTEKTIGLKKYQRLNPGYVPYKGEEYEGVPKNVQIIYIVKKSYQ